MSQVQRKFTRNTSPSPALDERTLNIDYYLSADRVVLARQRIILETYYVGRAGSVQILPVDPGYPDVIRQYERQLRRLFSPTACRKTRHQIPNELPDL